jgi:hypothetical protein
MAAIGVCDLQTATRLTGGNCHRVPSPIGNQVAARRQSPRHETEDYTPRMTDAPARARARNPLAFLDAEIEELKA